MKNTEEFIKFLLRLSLLDEDGKLPISFSGNQDLEMRIMFELFLFFINQEKKDFDEKEGWKDFYNLSIALGQLHSIYNSLSSGKRQFGGFSDDDFLFMNNEFNEKTILRNNSFFGKLEIYKFRFFEKFKVPEETEIEKKKKKEK